MLNSPCAVCGETGPAALRIWLDAYLRLRGYLTRGFVGQYPCHGEFTVVADYEDRSSLDSVDKGQEWAHPERPVSRPVSAIASPRNRPAASESSSAGCVRFEPRASVRHIGTPCAQFCPPEVGSRQC
jgi:hypothetical protein